MRNVRRFGLDELTLRPGTYFNPQTEIIVVVDDSPDVDNEIFEGAEVDAAEWVLISDETPIDEHQRDEMIERFQQSHQPGGEIDDDDVEDDDDVDLDPDEEDEDGDDDEDGLEELDPLGFGSE